MASNLLISESHPQTVKVQTMRSEVFKLPHFIHNFLNLLPSINCINNFDRSTSVKEERGEEGSTVGREGMKEGGRQAVGGWGI